MGIIDEIKSIFGFGSDDLSDEEAREAIEIGMTLRDVKRLLGDPDKSSTMDDVIAMASVTVSSGNSWSDSPLWSFNMEDGELQVNFERGRVTETRFYPTDNGD